MQMNNFFQIKELGHLPLQSQESKFLFRSFFRASGNFLLIGLAAFVIAYSFIHKVDYKTQVTLGFGGILGMIVLFLMRMYWMRNVARVSNRFLLAAYGINFLANSILFTFILTGLVMLDLNSANLNGNGSVNVAHLLKFTLMIFGGSFIVYAVPATIAYLLRNNHSAQHTIFKIYFYASIVSLALIAVMFFGSLWGQPGVFSRSISGIWNLVFLVIIVLQPMITLFRLGSVVRSLNFTDQRLVSKWNWFFAFEIMHDLIMIAWYFSRIMISRYSR